jgi:hypothetical protein
MNESGAKAALRAQGIRNPSKALLENWLRAHEHEANTPKEAEQQGASVGLETPNTSMPHPPSESALEPVLRERGQLERERPRKPGRPRVLAAWFQAVATAMSDGTPLRAALALCGVHGLTEREIRALYRNSALKAMREEARRKWLREWGFTPRQRRNSRTKTGPCKDDRLRLGMSREFRRSL